MSRNSPRLREPSPKPSSYAGPTICLRCDRAFESWDRRQNRLCPSCREAMAEQASDEPSSTIELPKRPFRPDHGDHEC
jgi:predicted amidophosphoribosyltransferase